MKSLFKKVLKKAGIQLNLLKNLKYLDSSYIIKQNTVNLHPVIFDVGACDGSSISDFKKMFPEAKIYSFEPYHESYNGLVEFSKFFSNIKHFKMALSNFDGSSIFFVNKLKATNSLLETKITHSFIDDHTIPESTVRVQTKKIDTFMFEHNISFIDILKLDVQGAEMMVLEGAKEALLNKQIGIIYSEIWFQESYKNQPLYHNIATYLGEYNYYPFGIYNMHYRKDGHFLWGDAIFLKEVE